MGRYTMQDHPLVDQVITDHLSLIRETSLQYTTPQAMLLAGSFGRGEGSVVVDHGKLLFYSDYEVCLISPSLHTRWVLDKISADIKQAIPVEISLFWNTPERIINNRTRNLSFGSEQPSIGMYELKAASQVFYGNFDLRKNLFLPREIPIQEGIRLILNRMMEVIDLWMDSSKTDQLHFAIAKLILACGDALLIKDGLYHYSYYERSKRFLTPQFEGYHLILGKEFMELFRKAANQKLHPGLHAQFSIDDGLRIAIKSTKTVLGFLLDIDNGNHLSILEKCACSIPLLYHTGFLPSMDRSYENLILDLRVRKGHHKINWKKIPEHTHPLTPFQALYAAIPALFWGLPLMEDEDDDMLEQVRKWGAWAVPDGMENSTNKLTVELIRMWHLMG